MKVCKVSGYETAFDFLVAWLKEMRGVVEDNMPDPNVEAVEYARMDGYATCCRAAIVLAEELRNKVMRAGRCKND